MSGKSNIQWTEATVREYPATVPERQAITV